MSDSNEVVTDPNLEKRTRRRFSVSEKKRLLADADELPRFARARPGAARAHSARWPGNRCVTRLDWLR